MKKNMAWSLALILLLTATGMPVGQAAPGNTVHPIEEAHVVLDETGMGFVNNILVLFVKPGTGEQEILSWFPGEEASIAGAFPGIGQVQVRIRPRDREALEALAKQMMQKEQVLYAHLDLAGAVGGYDEPQSYLEVVYGPTGNRPDKEWWYEAIGLKEAQKYLEGKAMAKVAVVDDGFDTDHPDLNLTFPGKEQKRLNSPEEHGTHVAGIVQQILPKAQILVTDSYRLPGDIPNSHLATQCQFLKYLVDLVEAGAKVVNLSMGSDTMDEPTMHWNVAYSGSNSVYVWMMKQAGHDFVIVQSAGNMGIDAYRNSIFCTLNKDNCLDSPEARASLGVSDRLDEAMKKVFDSIVIVGACDKMAAEGPFVLQEGSNHGEVVTLLAPGMNINSTVPGGYQMMGGTSQAAPIVSGAIGLIWSVYPQLDSGEIKALLLSSATEKVMDNNPANQRKEYPVLNLLAAVKQAEQQAR